MSELSVRQYLHNDGSGLTWGYDKSEADKVIAEKDAEIARLDDLAHAHNIELLRKENLIAEQKAREDVLVTDNRNLLDKVKMLEERLRENAEHSKRNEAQIIENSDKVIAEKDKEIAELEALNHDLCERVTENDEIRLHWEEIEQTRAENERMKARIAELEEERRWRKFPDEKPEEWDTVVVRLSDSFYDLAVYLSNGQGWDIGDGTYHKSEEVTHWMPLPSAPKEGK